MKESIEKSTKKAIIENSEIEPVAVSRDVTIKIEQERIRETVYLELKCKYLQKYMTPFGIKRYFIRA